MSLSYHTARLSKLLAKVQAYLADRTAPLVISAALTLLITLAPAVLLSIKLFDESLRQWPWYFVAKSVNSSANQVAILDLYTSETYNAAPNRYQERYDAYNLADSLAFFCKLQTKTVILDFYTDSTSWIGRHLATRQADRERLNEVLSCFERVLVPIQAAVEGQSSEDLSFLRPGIPGLRYVHLETLSSLIFPTSLSLALNYGQIQVPHAALAITGTEERWMNAPSVLLPLRFSYHPDSFFRFRYEEAELVKDLGADLSAQAAQELYPQLVSRFSLTDKLPSILLVGFTHDGSDQHNVAFNLGGELLLKDNQERKEPPLYATPGIYLLASHVAAIQNGEFPAYWYYDGPMHGLLLLLLLWGVVVLTRHPNSERKRIGYFIVYAAIYLGINMAAYLIFSIYLPLSSVLLALLMLYCYTFVRSHQDFLEILWEQTRPQIKRLQSSQGLTLTQPNTLLYAEQHIKALDDPYKGLLAKIDLISYWVQYLCLLSLADYQQNPESRSRVLADKEWLQLNRPTMGNYLMTFKRLNLGFNSLQQANSLAFFPAFYRRLTSHGETDLESCLHQGLDLRNDWKHFASANYSGHSVELAHKNVDQLYANLLQQLFFLKDFILLQPLSILAQTADKADWNCLVMSGSFPYLDRFETSENWNAGHLYAYCAVHRNNKPQVINLEPWIIAGECLYHNRKEVFFYAGLEREERTQHFINKARYAGLTESCNPGTAIALPDTYYRKLVNFSANKRR